nr:unnamed protein product [Digitaria exilis]
MLPLRKQAWKKLLKIPNPSSWSREELQQEPHRSRSPRRDSRDERRSMSPRDSRSPRRSPRDSRSPRRSPRDSRSPRRSPPPSKGRDSSPSRSPAPREHNGSARSMSPRRADSGPADHEPRDVSPAANGRSPSPGDYKENGNERLSPRGSASP